MYILMMVDQFTKWVEIVPLPCQTAEKIVEAAVNEFFARFGFPTYIHKDQGRNFDGNVMGQMC